MHPARANHTTYTLKYQNDRFYFDVPTDGRSVTHVHLTFCSDSGNESASFGVLPEGLSSSIRFSHNRSIRLTVKVAKKTWDNLVHNGWNRDA